MDFTVAAKYLKMLTEHPAAPEELPNGESLFYEWDPSLPYSSDVYATQIEKDPDKDFVILNFGDIQCHDGEAFCQVGEMAEETMDKLIRGIKPDMLSLSGDNAFDPLAYLRLIRFLDAYDIPWAACMGNADQRGLVSEFWADYQMAHAKNSLFDYGPKGMGDGNFIINIVQDGKTVHTLFYMDSHHEEMAPDGSEYYDHFWPSQIAWYEWAVRGIAAEEGHVVPSTVIMHMPVQEYIDAWKSAHDEKTGELKEPFRSMDFCKVHESFGTPRDNNGFFDKCLELGSTKLMLCGHDHINCFAIPYRGITLAYTMKTGYGCYWEKETNGGTTLSVDGNGNVAVGYHYIDPTKSRVKKFVIDYYGINLYGPKDTD